MDNVTSGLSAAWTAISEGVTQIMNQPVAALALTLPIAGMVIGVARRLFRGRRG